MEIDKKSVLSQLEDIAKVAGDGIVDDLKEWISDDKHDVMKKLAERVLKLKAKALVESDLDKRRQLAEDLEFAIARIKTKIEKEKIVVSKTVAAHVVKALKASVTVFSKVGEELVSSIVKGAVKGVAGSLGDGVSDMLDNTFAQD